MIGTDAPRGRKTANQLALQIRKRLLMSTGQI
jgi:hypothetical protein